VDADRRHSRAGFGHGLESMRQRASDVGGSLDVSGPAAGGTLVTAVLPLAVI
jgi:signal transduction histidine kinase